ncbi:hypothetical protein SERLA73DRAFT_73092 [Serpula lacrymans var. lacrymans S7.3]|uniref:Uncharacterized protein n=1 Tax=Serpula lacrymans var. lacrymans (strain S7.3) TaxID=936435 RepID=F8PWQ2_SERL3|nr:hypothetical protein SERLA73DRAFT_73092 [Serpula lacrymans var. lacrymans S7.3]
MSRNQSLRPSSFRVGSAQTHHTLERLHHTSGNEAHGHSKTVDNRISSTRSRRIVAHCTSYVYHSQPVLSFYPDHCEPRVAYPYKFRYSNLKIPSSDLANRRPHELQKKRGQVMDPTVLPSWGEEEKSGAGINLITRRDAHSSTHAVVDIPSALSSPSACTHCPCPQRRRREPQPLPRCLNFLSQNSYSSKNVKPASFGSVFRNNVIILLNEHTPQVSSVTPELGAE